MAEERSSGCCPGGSCDPEPAPPPGVSRRRFLTLTAGGVGAAFLASRAEAAYALGTTEDRLVLVPADKALDPDWVRSLYERGEPTVFSGADAKYLGMPVGGGCAGQLYLGGDGRLWHWDVYNSRARGTSDAAYATPPEPESPFGQGFALRTGTAGTTAVRTLDAEGFADVRFVGQYPMGNVTYADDACPVDVTLEAFSPFVPLAVDDSTLPVTVLAYTLKNTSTAEVDADLLGWSEHAVCLDARNRQPVTLTSTAFRGSGARGVQFTAADRPVDDARPDIVLETWEKDTYEGWTAEGDAFGARPVKVSDLPEYMLRFGDLHAEGERMVTSHRFEDGDAGLADDHVGTLTSQPFTLDRRYLQALVGGGAHDATCVQVRVGDEVVATFTGTSTEPMSWLSADVSRWAGEQATVRLVDDVKGGWGHVNVDTIRLSDQPVDPKPMDELPDHGTFALATAPPRDVHLTAGAANSHRPTTPR